MSHSITKSLRRCEKLDAKNSGTDVCMRVCVRACVLVCACVRCQLIRNRGRRRRRPRRRRRRRRHRRCRLVSYNQQLASYSISGNDA